MKFLALLLALPLGAMSWRDYRAELGRWSNEIARIETHPGEAARLRDALPPKWIVDHEGQHFEQPTTWLSSALDTIAHDPSTAHAQAALIHARLAALSDAAAALDTPFSSDKATRAKLSEILARREFNPRESWWEQLLKKIDHWLSVALEPVRRWLNKWFGRMRLPWIGDVSPPFLRLLALALLLGVIYFFSRRWLFRPDSASPPLVPLDAVESRRAWLDFGRRAAAAAESANFREAIRLAYWAGIYRLEELGLWRAESTRTHREYLRMLPVSAAQAKPLTAITRMFELAWYGGYNAGAEEFRLVTNHLEEMGCHLPSNQATANS